MTRAAKIRAEIAALGLLMLLALGAYLLGAFPAHGADASGVAIAPNFQQQFAIAPTRSVAAEGSRIFKASPGNLYSLVTTTGATPGFVLLYDATTAPVDGAVTPQACYVVAASTTYVIDFTPGPPARFNTGIVAVFSSTGCFTQTTSATAMFMGYFQ